MPVVVKNRNLQEKLSHYIRVDYKDTPNNKVIPVFQYVQSRRNTQSGDNLWWPQWHISLFDIYTLIIRKLTFLREWHNMSLSENNNNNIMPGYNIAYYAILYPGILTGTVLLVINISEIFDILTNEWFGADKVSSDFMQQILKLVFYHRFNHQICENNGSVITFSF